jgi:hypothetical protein
MIQIAYLTFENPNALMDAICALHGISRRDRRDIQRACREDTTVLDCVSIHINHVYSEGGGEGDGEYVEDVYQIVHDGQHVCYLRDQGHYDSYDGIEMNGDFKVVFPQQITITRYAEEGKQARV